MTIANVIPDIAFSGSSSPGTLGPFSLIKSGTPIIFYANSDIVVYRYDTTSDTAPALLVEGTDYTLTGGPTAGSITLTSPQTGLLTAEKLYVLRKQAFAQSLGLSNGGAFPSSSLERRLDIIETKMQELARDTRSAIRFAMFDTDEIPGTVPLTAVLDKIPYLTGTASAPTIATIDATELTNLAELSEEALADLAVVAADLGGADTIGIVAAAIDDVTAVADDIASVVTVANSLAIGTVDLSVLTTLVLTAIPPASRTDNMLVDVAGFAAVGDGGHGKWRFDADAVDAANGITILAPGTGTGRWFRQEDGPLYLECAGGGTGTAATDQTAFANAAAAGRHVHLRAGRTYYWTTGLTPITGFGITWEPGSKIVAVTQASGSGSAGFKNYSGLAANRNAVAGTMMMLTASGGVFTFVNPTIEGDNNNQPILRPIYALGCTLNIRGKITVTNMNAANGCLSLNEMLGGSVEGYDLRANADMVDASYTDLTNYSPAGIVVDDDGTFRSSRMTFGPGIVKGFNRAAGGADPFESDGITVGGIGKSLRSGAVGGHIFGPIYAEDLGEGVDCFQDDCVFESIKSKSCALFGVKFAHGAQRNVVQWLDCDTYGIAGITFAGSSTTTAETRDNVVLDGIMRNGGKVGSPSESYCVLFQDGGGTGYAEDNRVRLREVVIDSDTDYIAKDNHATSALDNRVRIDTVTGTPAVSAAITTVASNLQLRVGGGLTRLTMSGNQTGISSATYTTVNFDTVQTDLLSEAITASDKIRIKYPGRYVIRTSVRLALNAGDEVEVRILQNGAGSTSSTKPCGSSTIAENFSAERFINITENDAGTAAADFRVEVRVTSAGSITITNSALLTFFECVALD